MSALFTKEKDKSDNPFYDVPEPRAFYHPTLPKKLSKKSKGISLSPERQKSHLRPSEDGYHMKRKELSPGEKGFLSGSNTMLAKELPTHDTPSPGPADTSSKFNESWPASEHPSTIESPSNAQNVSSTSAVTSHISGSGSSLVSHGSTSTSMCKDPVTSARGQKSNQEAESTLGRLIDRFRFGAPQSREERARQQATGTKDFWWLSSSSSSPVLPSQQPSSSSISGQSPMENTPLHGFSSADRLRGKEGTRRGTGGGGRGKGRGTSRIPSWSGVSKSGVSSLSSSRRLSGGSTLASSSSSSLKMPSITDRETEEIQRRAEKLLEISEETVLSEPVVSSDGLGSFSTSSPITNDSTPPRGDEAYISRLNDKENLPRPTLFPANLSYTQQARDPQEDILQQWRMRRRMEQAKEGTLHRVSGRMVHSPLRQNQTENVGTRRDGREDADSKLADFRRRLQQQRLLTEARAGSNIQQIPVKDATTTHIGTDPIPQSIATQTGRGMPSCVQSGSRSLSADQTTNMQQDRTLRSDTMQNGDEGMPCQSVHPIASPNIQGVRTQRTRAADRVPNVTPHLHMSCDILPCSEIGPHVHTVQDVGDKEELAGQGKMHHHQTGLDLSCKNNNDHLLRESVRNNVVGTFPQRQTMLRVSSEDQRVTSENQRGASVAKPYQHQEKIQRHEHELRLDEAELHSHRYEGHTVGSDNEGEDEAFQHEVANNYSIRTSSNGFPRREGNRSGVGKEQMRDIEHYKAAEDTRTIQRPQTSAISIRTLEDTAEGLNAASSTRERDANPAAMQQTRTGDADQVEGAKRQLDFVSSSPINNAIGQVISNRIFSSPVGQRLMPSSQRSTPSSIRSSALSQDTLMFTPPASDRVTSKLRMSRDNMLDSAATGSLESESGASSDSEEFKDDEMLQVLRKQREECIHQLNHLDHLLSNSSKD